MLRQAMWSCSKETRRYGVDYSTDTNSLNCSADLLFTCRVSLEYACCLPKSCLLGVSVHAALADPVSHRPFFGGRLCFFLSGVCLLDDSTGQLKKGRWR